MLFVKKNKIVIIYIYLSFIYYSDVYYSVLVYTCSTLKRALIIMR
jgi:hypothetical protein